MARPEKEKELRRTHPVMLRFTDAEYERLLFYAEAARLQIRSPAILTVAVSIHRKCAKRINQGISDIYEMKYEVLRMAGGFLSQPPSNSAVTKGGSFHGNPEAYR